MNALNISVSAKLYNKNRKTDLGKRILQEY